MLPPLYGCPPQKCEQVTGDRRGEGEIPDECWASVTEHSGATNPVCNSHNNDTDQSCYKGDASMRSSICKVEVMKDN